MDVSRAGRSLLPSTDTLGTICCSCTPLSYIGCAMTSRGKPLLLQSIWACKDTGAALLQQPRQRLSFGIRCRHSCEGRCRSVWPVGCSALSLYLSKCLSGPDSAVHTRTLHRIKALVNEWHQGFDSHIVEVCCALAGDLKQIG